MIDETRLIQGQKRQHHDQGNRNAFKDQHQDRREGDVLVGEEPCGEDADRKERDRRMREIPADAREIQQLGREVGKSGNTRDADEHIRKDQAPAGHPADLWPEPLHRVLVHAARRRIPLTELIQADGHKQQHDRAEEIAEPSGRARRAKHQRDDQRGRHARGDERHRLSQDLPEIQRVGFQSGVRLLDCLLITGAAVGHGSS